MRRVVVVMPIEPPVRLIEDGLSGCRCRRLMRISRVVEMHTVQVVNGWRLNGTLICHHACQKCHARPQR